LKTEPPFADITHPPEVRFERRFPSGTQPFETAFKAPADLKSKLGRSSSTFLFLLMLMSFIYMLQYLYRRDANHTKAQNEFILALEAQQTSLENSIQTLALLNREIAAAEHTDASEAQIQQLKTDVRMVTGLLHDQASAQQQIVKRVLDSLRTQVK
jgi:hypothetical protein